MNNNFLNEDYTKSRQQPTEKQTDNKIYESNLLEPQIIKKLTLLEQVIDASIKKCGDKSLTLTRKNNRRKK